MRSRESSPRNTGATANDLSGTVLGTAVQANTIVGGVHLHVVDGHQTVVPQQLPAPPRSFTGRAAELAALDAAVEAESRTVAISAIGGMGGIGKTSLALRWSHDNRHRFPDGQLYVNLRGFDPGERVLQPAVALRGFLDALGVEPSAIPTDFDAQTALYRSLLTDRRMLVVLDNARDVDQVTPLLPGAGSCSVIVTSRRRLTGLATAHGARLLALDVLDTDAAEQLLVDYLGRGRVEAERAAVRDLVASSGHLPLALSIVAARAALYADFPLEEFAAELRDARQRLDALGSDDPQSDLRAVFDWSYRALAEPQRRLFRLLGTINSPDTTTSAVMSLLGAPEVESRRLLRDLVDVHLVENHRPGRFRMHDLVRLCAAEHAESVDSEGDRAEAGRRWVDFHVHSAVAASKLVDERRTQAAITDRAPGANTLDFTDRADAMKWLDVEHACLLAAGRFAVANGWHTRVWQLAHTLDTFHWRRGHIHDHVALWQDALDAAVRLGDQTLEARAHRYLGFAASRADRHDDAVAHLHQALALNDTAVDVREQARVHQDLAHAWERQGDDRRALDHALVAAPLFKTAGEPVWEARALNLAGRYLSRLGQPDDALAFCERSLALSRRFGDPDGEAATLDCLADLHFRGGRHQEAVELHEQALRLRQRLGNTYGEAESVEGLGRAQAALGWRAQAIESLERARGLYRSQNRQAEAAAVHALIESLST